MKRQNTILLCTFILAFVLRVWRLGSHSYNSAEIGVIGTSIKSILTLLPEGIRSPFFRLLLYGWIKAFSLQGHIANEFTTRMFSVLFGSLAVFPIYFLVKNITDKKVAELVICFTAISPFYILFSREVTDFGISLFFISLSLLLFFLVFCEKANSPGTGSPNNGLRIGYIIITILMLYSVPLGFLILLGEWVYFLLRWKKHQASLIKRWATAQVFILLFYSYWLVRFYQEFPLEWNALSKMPTTLINKIAYTFFAFSLGETVLPWNWKVVLPAGIVFMTIFIVGIRKMRRNFSVLSFISILFVVNLIPLLTNRGAPDYCVGASIMYYIILAFGLTRLLPEGRHMPTLEIGFGLCFLFNSYSLYNLYTDKNYNMQSITDDWRNVANIVKKLSDESIPGTKIVSFHTSFNWYCNTVRQACG